MSELTKYILKIIVIILVGYLLGNIHFATLIARLKGKNIRELGSGNPGTMNMLRNFGIGTAILTLVLDALKGAIPTLFGYFLLNLNQTDYLTLVNSNAPVWLGYFMPNATKLGMYIGGFSAVVGHVFPVFSKFKGGKGVASSIGVFFAVNPSVMLIVFIAGFLYLLFFKYGFIASFICILGAGIIEIVLCAVFKDSFIIYIIDFALMTLVVAAHHQNIVKFFKGTESDSNLLKRIKASRAKSETDKDLSSNPPV